MAARCLCVLALLRFGSTQNQAARICTVRAQAGWSLDLYKLCKHKDYVCPASLTPRLQLGFGSKNWMRFDLFDSCRALVLQWHCSSQQRDNNKHSIDNFSLFYLLNNHYPVYFHRRKSDAQQTARESQILMWPILVAAIPHSPVKTNDSAVWCRIFGRTFEAKPDATDI